MTEPNNVRLILYCLLIAHLCFYEIKHPFWALARKLPADAKSLICNISAHGTDSGIASMNKGSIINRLHSIWLVKDIEVFANNLFSDSFSPSSTSDRLLNIYMTHEEWGSIWFDELKVDIADYEDWVDRVKNNRTDKYYAISGYPLLSRISDNFMDASYKLEECSALRNECDMAITRSTSHAALRGLKKLASACNEAESSGMSLYFVCD
jgi:hypothetical protein